MKEGKVVNYNVLLHAFLYILSVFIGSSAQVLLKKAALKKYSSHLEVYLNKYVILGYALMLGTIFLTILAYRGIPLSLGAILDATSYIFVTVFGVTIFRERIDARKILALGMIILGILIYAIFG